MNKHDKETEILDKEPSESQSPEENTEQVPDINERIYYFLDKLESIAIKAARINSIIRIYRIRSFKKKKKKNKKLGKINKKTGAVKLKSQKKLKSAKHLKRYTEKKK